MVAFQAAGMARDHRATARKGFCISQVPWSGPIPGRGQLRYYELKVILIDFIKETSLNRK